MSNSDLIAKHIRLLVSCLAVTLAGACSTSSNSGSGNHVRKVDFGVSPRSQAMAKQAMQTGNRLYPEVCALLDLGHSRFPRQFDIRLKPSLERGNMGEAGMKQISLNGKYSERFATNPACLDQVLTHEMVHIAQRYRRYYGPIFGKWLVFDTRPPAYWVEGIADYVCFKLGQSNALRCAECSSFYPHYRDGYSCAGAFLLYLEQTYNRNIVAQLNAALRQERYRETFFLQATGKGLPTLWAEFQTTRAFTPSAARMLKLQEEFGFLNGIPPKDIERRISRFIEQNVDPRLKRIMEFAEFPGLSPGSVQSRLVALSYFTQQGGTAEAYMIGLQEGHNLPGFATGERGTLTSELGDRDLNQEFPAQRTFSATKQGDECEYHYTVFRGAKETEWKLQRAWKTRPDHTVAEEYPIP